MIKDIAIAILAGIAIAQRITQPGDPARGAVMLMTAVMAFMAVLEVEDLWDRRLRIRQQIGAAACAVSRGLLSCLRRVGSRMRWWKIRLRTWPAECAHRRRRRQMMMECIRRLRDMPPEERGRNRPRRPEERKA